MKTLLDYFDQIYCVSYVGAQTRRNIVEKQFLKLGLIENKRDITYSYGYPFRAFNAIDKKALFDFALKSGMSSNISSLSCSFAHYMAIKAAYESGAKSVIIFEDDISCINNREMIFDYMDSIPGDWEFLYFTPSFIKESFSVNDINLCRDSKDKFINLKKFSTGILHWNPFYNNVTTWISAAGYALTRNAMKLYIAMVENNGVIDNADTIEYFFHNIGQSPFVSYTTNRRLFAQMSELDSLKYDHTKNEYVCKFLESDEYCGVIPNDINVTSQNFIYAETPSIISEEFTEYFEETDKKENNKKNKI